MLVSRMFLMALQLRILLRQQGHVHWDSLVNNAAEITPLLPLILMPASELQECHSLFSLQVVNSTPEHAAQVAAWAENDPAWSSLEAAHHVLHAVWVSQQACCPSEIMLMMLVAMMVMFNWALIIMMMVLVMMVMMMMMMLNVSWQCFPCRAFADAESSSC